MASIRITKEFSFEAAHALKGYDGPCRNIHGHSYHLSVTVTGNPVTSLNSPKRGMIMDFSELKTIMKAEVIDRMDHALILPSDLDISELKKLGETFSKVIVVDYQPTSENLLSDFAERISKALPDEVKLHSMKLRETATSYAEWYAD
ncbi:MAG: 6-carboxytetrahydropterin synthase QueD [Bacteroidales bacterium]|nr:6-carboxytetrahydropterin synthase QueD [Bacteroidales bacterium]